MTEQKKWYIGYVCGDYGLVSPNGDWVIENTRNINDLEENWDTAVECLNALHEEKELEIKRTNYLKRVIAENCPRELLIHVQNDLEWIE